MKAPAYSHNDRLCLGLQVVAYRAYFRKIREDLYTLATAIIAEVSIPDGSQSGHNRDQRGCLDSVAVENESLGQIDLRCVTCVFSKLYELAGWREATDTRRGEISVPSETTPRC